MAFRAAGIEGLRGIAAVAVVVAHTIDFMILPGLLGADATPKGSDGGGLKLLSGFSALGVHGVTVFFVISGFLLYRPFVKQVSNGEQTLQIREFLRNRFLRIFPGYLIVFVLAAFVLGTVVTKVASDAGPEGYVGRMTDPLLIFTNLTLTQGYLPQGQLTGLGASWSLVPELAFYLLLPFFWMAARRLSRRMRWQAAVTVPVLAMLVVGAGFRCLCAVTTLADGQGMSSLSASTWRAVLWHSILTQGDLFALGMLVAILSVQVRVESGQHDRRGNAARISRRSWILLIVCLIAFLPAKAVLFDAPVVGLGAACFIAAIVLGRGRLTTAGRAVLEWKPVDRAGLISYSLYLWHVPVIFFLTEHFPGVRFDSIGTWALDFLLVLAISWVLSEVTFALVERPALSRKRPMVPRDVG